MQRLFLVLTLFLVGGCATTPKADLAQFQRVAVPKYPPVTVVLTSEEMQYYSNRAAFLGAVQEAGYFESVEVDNPYSEFALEVNIQTTNESMENNAEGFTKAIVAGGTLGLVPVEISFRAEGTVKLRFNGVVFDQFKVATEYTSNFSLYNIDSKDAGIMGSYRKFVEAMLGAIEERESYKKLVDMIQPEKVDTMI